MQNLQDTNKVIDMLLKNFPNQFSLTDDERSQVQESMINSRLTFEQAYKLLPKNVKENIVNESAQLQKTRDNYETAKFGKNSSFITIWNFLTDDTVYLSKTGLTAEQIAQKLNDKIFRDTTLKRISDLKVAGLLKIIGTTSYKTKDGREVSRNVYKAANKEPFEKISHILALNLKKNELKKHAVLDSLSLRMNELILDRNIADNDRYEMIKELCSALVNIVDNNPQVPQGHSRSLLPEPKTFAESEVLLEKYKKVKL